MNFKEEAARESTGRYQAREGLKCIPPTSKPPANISWLLNGRPLQYRDGLQKVYYDFSTSSLEFTRLSYDDAGTYVCQASNHYAPVTLVSSRPMSLRVQGAWSYLISQSALAIAIEKLPKLSNQGLILTSCLIN